MRYTAKTVVYCDNEEKQIVREREREKKMDAKTWRMGMKIGRSTDGDEERNRGTGTDRTGEE